MLPALSRHTIAADEDRTRYYPAFDFLRFWLALQVAASHTEWLHLDGMGPFSVQVFFAMSGWLIGSILLRSDARDLPRFFFHRVARIWLPYLAALTILIALSLLKDSITRKWVEFIFYDATFTFNVFGSPQYLIFPIAAPLNGSGTHFWSICAEEQFYLFAPLLIVFTPIGKSAWTWAGVAAIAFLYPPLTLNFGAISLGVLAAALRRRVGDWQIVPSAVLVTAGCLAVVATLFFMGAMTRDYAFPLAGTCILLLCARPASGTPSKLAVHLGGVSYPLYLNHWIAIRVFHALHFTGPAGQIAALLADVLIAAVLYRFIDLPIKRYRDDYFTPRLGIVCALVGLALVAVGLLAGIIVFGRVPFV